MCECVWLAVVVMWCVYVGWVRWVWVGMCVGVGVWEGGQEGHIAVIISIMDFSLPPVCVFIVISLNAFDVTLMFVLHVGKLTSL